MLICVLGAVTVRPDDGPPQIVHGRVPAAVLARLATVGRAVSAQDLAAFVWDSPPSSWRNAVQVAVSRLRGILGAECIESGPAGYRLRSGLVRVDWTEAAERNERAREALEGGRALAAEQAAALALSAWTGQPLAGLDSLAAEAARVRAETLRRDLVLLRCRALMRADRAAEAARILAPEAEADDLNEPLHALLIEALARSDSSADALAAYDGLRHRLADRLGADPSATVTAVFTSVLRGELAPTPPQLTAPSAGPDPAPAAARPMPWSASPLLGRADDLDRLGAAVSDGHRLVTVLGPGGIGKTRLAVALADRLSLTTGRPAAFVDLTAALEPLDVPRVVRAAVGAGAEGLGAALAGSRMLVVLDNAEHVVEAVRSVVAELLAVHGVDLLVTSRSPLGLREERVVGLDPLDHSGLDSPALRLLTDRAGLDDDDLAVQAPDLRLLARRADGVPLVLELLASALRWQPAVELLRDLDAHLPTLADGAPDRPARHTSVAAAIGWSVDQADEPARRGLGALVLLQGTFDLPTAVVMLAAAAPTAPPRALLATLTDLSLVQRVRSPGAVRFRVLEPIRAYARSAAAVPPPNQQVRAAHARWFFAALAAADALMSTDDGAIE